MVLDTKESAEDTRLNDNQNPYNEGSSINDAKKAEQQSTFDSMVDKENYSKDGKSGDLSGGAKNAEKNPDATFKNNFKEEAKNVAKATLTKTPFVKRKGPMGFIVGLLISGTVFGGFMAGQGLLFHIASSLKLNGLISTTQILDRQLSKVFRSQLAKDSTTGLCVPVNIRCKFNSMTKTQISILEEAGFKVETFGKKFGDFRSRVLAIYDQDNVRIDANNLDKHMRENSKLKSAIRKINDPIRVAFSSTAFKNVLNKIGATKAMSLPKNFAENQKNKFDNMKQALKDRVTGTTQAMQIAKITVDDEGNYKDEQGNTLDESTREAKMAAASEKYNKTLAAKKAAVSVEGFFAKTAVKSTLIGVGAAQIGCVGWQTIRTAEAVSKYLGAVQLANLSQTFISSVEAIQAGDGTADQAEFLGTLLTTPNDSGLTATDSRGLRNVLYGDVSPIPDAGNVNISSDLNLSDESAAALTADSEITQYVNGGATSNTAKDSILDIIPGVGTGGAGQAAADEACSIINSTEANVLLISVGVVATAACYISAVFTLGASAPACITSQAGQVGIAIAIAGTLAIAMHKINSVFSGDLITGNENGNQFGNALASGTGALNYQTGMASGLGMVGSDNKTAYIEKQNQYKKEVAALDRLNYSPLDASNSNTFMGTLVDSLAPFLSKTSTIGSYFSSISKLPLSAFGSIFKSADAIDGANVCQDYDYKDYATDINCNPLVSLSDETLSIDVDQMLDYMINNNHIDEVSGAAKSNNYKDYIKYCANRETPIGTYPEGGDFNDITTGKICSEDYNDNSSEMYSMFRAYISSSIALEGLTGEETSALNTTTSYESISANSLELYSDSTNIQCAAGTNDAGVETGYHDGVAVSIRLCEIPGTIDRAHSGRPATVNSRMSGNFAGLISDLKGYLGVPSLTVNSSFRTMSDQQYAYTKFGSKRAAKPGYSNHQMGLAIDFQLSTTSTREDGTFDATKPRGVDKIYDYLLDTSSKYSISKLSTEAWHWQAAGLK